jgi:ribosomal protein S18 acetylase RimI-like enzyme
VTVEIREESVAVLAEYATVSIAFEVDRVLAVIPDTGGMDGYRLEERPVEHPWIKDYDATDGEHPLSWPARYEISNWCFLIARDAGTMVGGLTVRAPAQIWDIRVAPHARGSGIGAALFRAGEDWARNRGCTELTVETQNVNVAACRFYERQGCRLLAIRPNAYPALPDEAQLIWGKDLGRASPAV